MTMSGLLKTLGWKQNLSDEQKREICADSIRRLDEANLLIEQRQKILQKEADLCLQNARLYARRDRTRARTYLLNRRRYEAEYMKCTTLSDTVVCHKLALQNAAMAELVMNALKSSMDAMRAISSHASLKDAESLMDKLQDNSDSVSEMSSVLSQPLVPLDENALDSELDALLLEDEGGEPQYAPRPPLRSSGVPSLASRSSSSTVLSAGSVVPPPSLACSLASMPATTATSSSLPRDPPSSPAVPVSYYSSSSVNSAVQSNSSRSVAAAMPSSRAASVAATATTTTPELVRAAVRERIAQ
jgi:hypothetical protein